MNTAIMDLQETYREVNSITGTVGSVIFGSDRLAGLPVAELVQNFGLNLSVCNRSVEGASLADAFGLLHECVFDLKPHKVFLNFGDAELDAPGFDCAAFLSEYERLIATIQENCSGRVYVVSVLRSDGKARQVNDALERICMARGCTFVDAENIFHHDKPKLQLFSMLVHCMREGRISFAEAMGIC